MENLKLALLKNLKKDYLQGIFCTDPEDKEDDYIKYKLCENSEVDDGTVYVVLQKDASDRFKRLASNSIKRILSGTPYSEREIKFIYTGLIYVEDTGSC